MSGSRVYRLQNPIQTYAWGSHGAISALQGRPPSESPEAELWLGAHPVAPSRVRHERQEVTLDAWIAESPTEVIGALASDRFGALPFLLKVLAAEAPLSIQAHPNADQARAGFARENARGIPLDAPTRCYRDARHKPELIVALTPFVALNRFREPGAIAARLDRLGLAELAPTATELRTGAGAPALATFFRVLVELGPAARRRLRKRALEVAGEEAGTREAEWVRRLAELHGDDACIIAPWFLNWLELRPGEAMFLGAGELHAYLDGVAIECMASSDNVLRGGLTTKHRDHHELLSVLTFASGAVDMLNAQPRCDVESRYETPVDDFALSRLTLREGLEFVAPAEHGAEILLCVEGACSVSWDHSEPLAFERGESVFVPASVPAYRVDGSGVVFRATDGLSR